MFSKPFSAGRGGLTTIVPFGFEPQLRNSGFALLDEKKTEKLHSADLVLMSSWEPIPPKDLLQCQSNWLLKFLDEHT